MARTFPARRAADPAASIRAPTSTTAAPAGRRARATDSASPARAAARATASCAGPTAASCASIPPSTRRTAANAEPFVPRPGRASRDSASAPAPAAGAWIAASTSRAIPQTAGHAATRALWGRAASAERASAQARRSCARPWVNPRASIRLRTTTTATVATTAAPTIRPASPSAHCRPHLAASSAQLFPAR